LSRRMRIGVDDSSVVRAADPFGAKGLRLLDGNAQ
jgi:hypothetical protein